MPHYQRERKPHYRKKITMVQAPAVNSTDYDEDEYVEDAPAVLDDELLEDAPDANPKHGTSVQAGWGAADTLLKPKDDYPNDFKFTDSLQLVKFLQDEPFSVYQQHWLDRSEGKRSFVCLGDDCPLCDMLGDKPRGKFAFNVLLLSGEDISVQILTAPPTFARMLRAAGDDPKRGPLSKYYWAVSRHGSGPQTTYTLERVRGADLADEWDLDPEKVDETVESAALYGPETIYVTPKSELVTIARSLIKD